MSLPASNGRTVLITGINGYIASGIGMQVLSKGYNLRGTSRSFERTAALMDGAYKKYVSRIEIVEVPDITAPGAFDKTVRGVYAILHTASPANFSLKGWDNFVTPAIQGCTSILRSALAHGGSQLESFVVTSSVAAVTDYRANDPTYSYTELDWNNGAEAKARELGNEASTALLYPASKVAAEKAVWEFRANYNPPFSISSVIPAVVCGPPVDLPADPSHLNESMKPIWAIFSGKAQAIPAAFGTASCVDVRDVARVHVWCMEHPSESANQRYIACAGKGPPQAIADILREAYPDRREMIPLGEPGKGYMPDYSFPEDGINIDGSKAERTAGFMYIRFDQSILDTARVLEQYL
ncbi:MAG: hypothetical protein M1812_002442 [Candelaria pacifica]|nr:MAG: hypothetical protein M1812_002442 [Candelaria pacifica]